MLFSKVVILFLPLQASELCHILLDEEGMHTGIFFKSTGAKWSINGESILTNTKGFKVEKQHYIFLSGIRIVLFFRVEYLIDDNLVYCRQKISRF